MKLGLSKLKVLELPISYNPRSISEGKKIRLIDAWRGLLLAFSLRINFR